MAQPPKLPPDAFKQPGNEPESPFDVISSAPKPVARKQREPLALPTWAGRYPIAAHDHSTQLDMDAAVNEFGLKMPREQAEDEAYRQYLYHPQRGQHAQAAIHHLRGMKAAHAAGDMDAARNHSLMLGLHAKALGKQPHEVALDLQSQMQGSPPMTKFKSHRGDAFAATTPPPQAGTGVISSSPPPQLNKREQEVLHMIYLMSQAVLAKAEKKSGEELKGKRTKERCHQCGKVSEIGADKHYNHCPQYMAQQPEIEKGEVVKGPWSDKSGEQPKSKKLGPTSHYPDHDAKKCGSFKCPSCNRKMPSCRGGEGPKCDDCEAGMHKGEMKSNKHCKCDAYHFPHRHGGGKCKESK